MLYRLLLLVHTRASRSPRKASQRTLQGVPCPSGLGAGSCRAWELGAGNRVALSLLERSFGRRARRRGIRGSSATGPSQRAELVCLAAGWGPSESRAIFKAGELSFPGRRPRAGPSLRGPGGRARRG